MFVKLLQEQHISLTQQISAIIRLIVSESAAVLNSIVEVGAITPLITQISSNITDIQINVSNPCV